VQDCSGTRVECDIFCINLEDSEYPWHALSHVWGTAERNQEIVLNGKTFYTTSNLLAALKAVDTLQRRENSTLLIWIDAICINQGDVQEKAQQVPLMGRIFSKANIVLIWLGSLESGEQIFVEVLKWLSAHTSIEEIGHDNRQSEQRDRSSHILEACHRITGNHLRALFALFKDLEALHRNQDNERDSRQAPAD
jgi:hypothetical protein